MMYKEKNSRSTDPFLEDFALFNKGIKTMSDFPDQLLFRTG